MPAFATAGAPSASRHASAEGGVTQHIPAKAGSPSRKNVGAPLYSFTSTTRGRVAVERVSVCAPSRLPGNSAIAATERGIIFRTSRLCIRPFRGHPRGGPRAVGTASLSALSARGRSLPRLSAGQPGLPCWKDSPLAKGVCVITRFRTL